MSFLYAGRVSTIVFDKTSNTMLVTKTNLCCAKKYKCHSIDAIKSTKACLRGTDEGSVYTKRYFLIVFVATQLDNSLLQLKLMQSSSAFRV